MIPPRSQLAGGDCGVCIYSLVLFPSRVAKRLIKVNCHGDYHQGNGCTTEYYNIIADVHFYSCFRYVCPSVLLIVTGSFLLCGI